jgi:glucokinase
MREAANAANCDVSDLAGVGVGTPGAVDRARGTVTSARNLPGFAGMVPLGVLLSDELGIPTQLGNDVGVALDAEARLGAGKDARSFLGVWWGTGVGGGFVVDGERWMGRGAAGEIGHTVVKREGARCPCGRRGCLEAYAGRRAMELRARELVERGESTILFNLAKRKGLDRLTSSVWAKAYEKGDPLAVRLIERAVGALGTGIASAVNLLDVEAVIIGGGFGSRMGERVAVEIEDAMIPHLFASDRPPRVRVAGLGDYAGAVGASLLVAPVRDA